MNFFLVSGPMWAKLFLPRSTKILQIRKSANSKINKFIIDSECTPFIICDFWRLQLSRNTYYIYLILPLEPISTPQLLANYKKIWQKELSIVKKGRIVKKIYILKSQLPPCLEPSVSYGPHAWFCHLFVFSNSIHRVCILLFFVNTGAWTHSSVL